MTYRTWIGASAAVLLTAVTAAALYLWNQTGIDNGITAVAAVDPTCDLQQGACQARFADGGRITLTLLPRPVQGLHPIRIQVLTEGIDARAMEVDFRGQGMNMGFNRPRLKLESAGRYAGSGMLSACILERMSWEATVLARTDQGLLAAPFVFETLKP
jgi:hypothetical protein